MNINALLNKINYFCKLAEENNTLSSELIRSIETVMINELEDWSKNSLQAKSIVQQIANSKPNLIPQLKQFSSFSVVVRLYLQISLTNIKSQVGLEKSLYFYIRSGTIQGYDKNRNPINVPAEIKSAMSEHLKSRLAPPDLVEALISIINSTNLRERLLTELRGLTSDPGVIGGDSVITNMMLPVNLK